MSSEPCHHLTNYKINGLYKCHYCCALGFLNDGEVMWTNLIGLPDKRCYYEIDILDLKECSEIQLDWNEWSKFKNRKEYQEWEINYFKTQSLGEFT